MSETVVKVENLVKRYKELIALDHFFFFIMADPGGKDRLMFWDISKEVSGTDLVFEELETEKLSE
ncbi:MAG: hypothetical protein IJO99_06430, partial [Ruminococcus sp.]|nr:hypothetical protein [Ruminococcus sp.]